MPSVDIKLKKAKKKKKKKRKAEEIEGEATEVSPVKKKTKKKQKKIVEASAEAVKKAKKVKKTKKEKKKKKKSKETEEKKEEAPSLKAEENTTSSTTENAAVSTEAQPPPPSPAPTLPPPSTGGQWPRGRDNKPVAVLKPYQCIACKKRFAQPNSKGAHLRDNRACSQLTEGEITEEQYREIVKEQKRAKRLRDEKAAKSGIVKGLRPNQWERQRANKKLKFMCVTCVSEQLSGLFYRGNMGGTIVKRCAKCHDKTQALSATVWAS